MSWTIIDETSCSQCTICAQICPGCYQVEEERIVSHANEYTCVLCGKCVGICPEGAITHKKMDMTNFPEVTGYKLIETANLVQFIRERRAHRVFKDKPISQSDLQLLVDTARYTPTGHNAMDVEIIVVRTPERVKAFSDLAVDYYENIVKKLEKRIWALKEKNGSAQEISGLEGQAGFLRMIVDRRAAGADPIFYSAPAVMIFHATSKEITPKDDCVISATMIGMLARTMGLETTFIAMFEMAANTYPQLQAALNLPEGNKIFSVIVMGYPKFKYKRMVDRRPVKVTWE